MVSMPKKHSNKFSQLVLESLEYKEGKVFWKTGKQKGQRAGCVRPNLYRQIRLAGTSLREHRVVWFLMHGYWPDFLDHINGNRKDNRIENLREVTLRGNQNNRVEHRKGKLVGVYQVKGTKRWFSRIQLSGKKVPLGGFRTAQEAHAAYMRARPE